MFLTYWLHYENQETRMLGLNYYDCNEASKTSE